MFGNFDPILLIYKVPVILLSLAFHEFSHAMISNALGDPTAKNRGRLTLNPIKHLDILGTLMLFVSNFGWAKPVPINPAHYRDRKKGTMLVSLAGPLSNVILALVFSIPMLYIRLKYGIRWLDSFDIVSILYNLSTLFYMINISLAIFNILPIPPLDGSKILSGLLPSKYYFRMLQYESYVGVGFLLLIFAFPQLLSKVLSPFYWVFDTAISFIVKPIINMLL